MKKIVFALMLTVVGSCAVAEWVKMGEHNEDGNVARGFIDSTTVRSNGNLRRATTLMNMRLNGKETPSSVMSMEFDCWERRQRLLSVTIIEGPMDQGGVINLPAEATAEMEKAIGVWDNIPSGSGPEATLKYVCAIK